MTDIFKTLAWDRLAATAFKVLLTRLPILALGPLNAIAQFFFFKLTDLIYSELKLQVELKQIEFKNGEFDTQFKQASVTLKMIGIKHGITSAEYQKAYQDFKLSLDKLVSF